MRNPFKIQEEEYLHTENINPVSLIKRFLVFSLDFTLFFFLMLITAEFIKKFSDTTYLEEIPIIIFLFFSVIFSVIEYYFDGTIFKIIFGIRCIRKNGEKLNYFQYLIKYFFRFIALFLGVLRIWLMFIPLVFIINLLGGFKNLYGIIPDFMNGKMKSLWYDDVINQNVIYIKK